MRIWLSLIILAIILFIFMRPREPSKQVIISVIQQTPGAKRVDLYQYYNKYVLLVDVTCCDHWVTVYTFDGKRLGAPSGGITGHGDGQLQDWGENSRFIRTVYVISEN